MGLEQVKSRKRAPRLLRLEHLEKRRLFAADVAAPVIADVARLSSSSGEYNFQLTGTADPFVRVAVSQTGVGFVGDVLADASGSWAFDVLDAQFASTKFQFLANAIDSDGDQSPASASVSFQPNIVLINTDDMRLDQLQFMPFLSSISQNATMFQNAFAPTAVSGPSRASLLSGLLASNNGVVGNSPTMGSGLNFDDSSTLPTWLSDAGYRTGLFGKDRTLPGLENQYESQDVFAVPPGWDTYFAGINGGAIGYGTGFSDNGVLFTTGLDEHTTDVLSDRVLSFIDADQDDPFFAYLATNAPHAPGTPAARHDHVHDNLTLPDSPSLLVGDSVPPAETIEIWEQWYREGSESLLGVDESLQAIFTQLGDNGKLDNSVIVFMSDNGANFGEHGFFGKNRFWEEAIRIPLMVWDGRAQLGQSTDSLATVVDITATIVALADAEPPEEFDGRSLTPILEDPAVKVREDFLIEHYTSLDLVSESTEVEHGVRNSDWVYVESGLPHDGDYRFLFDLANDPYQLNNLYGDPAYESVQEEMAERLEELRPADRLTPEVSEILWSASGGDYQQPQDIELTFVVDDTSTGGSQIRTPSVSSVPGALFGAGRAAEPVDGVFNSPVEQVKYTARMQSLAQATDPTKLYVAVRDVVGNFGQPMEFQVPLDAPLRLLSADGSGDTAPHNLVVGGISEFAGNAQPNARVAIFTASGAGEFQLAGTTIADSQGEWRASAELLVVGEHTVYAQIAPAQGLDSQDVLFSTPMTLRVLAAQNGNRVDVLATREDDNVVVDLAEDGRWRFTMDDLTAGTLPPAALVYVNGHAGNDTLEIRGPIRSRLLGWTGDDILIGGTANDVLLGGTGLNHLYGGPGNDNYIFAFSDRVILNDISTSASKDYVHEVAEEGTDRVTLIGDLQAVGQLDAGTEEPTIDIQSSSYDYSRTIHFDDPTTIERVDADVSLSHWRLDNHTRVFLGAGDDTVVRPTRYFPGEQVDLRSLLVGENDVFTGDIRYEITTDVGELSIAAALPADTVLISNAPTRIVLEGPVDQINTFIDSLGIQMLAFESEVIQSANIEATTYPLADPSTVQRDVLVATVAGPPPHANDDLVGGFLGDQSVAVNVLSNDTGNLNRSSVVVSTPPQIGTATANADGSITYALAPGFVGEDEFAYSVEDSLGVRLEAAVVTIRVVASGRQNPIEPTDVNGSGFVTPLDALLVINKLADEGFGVPVGAGERGPNFWDVDGNLRISPLDAILVILHIANSGAAGASGELVSDTAVDFLHPRPDDTTKAAGAVERRVTTADQIVLKVERSQGKAQSFQTNVVSRLSDVPGFDPIQEDTATAERTADEKGLAAVDQVLKNFV